MANIYSLENYYHFVHEKHGKEYADLLKELIDESVARETSKLKENIDILANGLEQAIYHIYSYRRKYSDIIDNVYSEDIIKAEKLSYKIYGDNGKIPFYVANVNDRRDLSEY